MGTASCVWWLVLGLNGGTRSGVCCVGRVMWLHGYCVLCMVVGVRFGWWYEIWCVFSMEGDVGAGVLSCGTWLLSCGACVLLCRPAGRTTHICWKMVRISVTSKALTNSDIKHNSIMTESPYFHLHTLSLCS